ncbi:hypothetical protein SAMN05216196_11713 [Lutimaribacter pacificus]|uniref:Uncharacterized protein n=1 Tax=Lutimaribacter pacificus TaxID=391948 RepID=A0A1H0P940_9RHOB|nr:hypothetical protein SAMN05216196_11713 [Lutimaribacter pacificus]SHL02950.1 hypothetical protein SAMN05444142_1191 [Lutimaribacter pacificus]
MRHGCREQRAWNQEICVENRVLYISIKLVFGCRIREASIVHNDVERPKCVNDVSDHSFALPGLG